MRAALGLLLALALVAPALVAPAAAQLGVPFSAPAPLAFSPVTILPMGTRAAGSYPFGAVTVPTGVVALQAIVDVSQASEPLPTMTTILEGSRDGGTTWMSAGAWEQAVGPKGLNRDGQPLTQFTPGFYGGPFWSDTQNANRRLRGVASLGGSMRFSLVVQPR